MEDAVFRVVHRVSWALVSVAIAGATSVWAYSLGKKALKEANAYAPKEHS